MRDGEIIKGSLIHRHNAKTSFVQCEGGLYLKVTVSVCVSSLNLNYLISFKLCSFLKSFVPTNILETTVTSLIDTRTSFAPKETQRRQKLTKCTCIESKNGSVLYREHMEMVDFFFSFSSILYLKKEKQLRETVKLHNAGWPL